MAMATSGIGEGKLEQLKTMFLDVYTCSVNDEGVCTRGNSGWGALRYPGNHAFLAAIWAEASGDTSLDEFIFNQVDYIMGSNNAGQSFIVGFCEGCTSEVHLPHHRNVFLRDDNPDDSAKAFMEIPERNRQFGYMVGGTWNSSEYVESVMQYQFTEGGIDYNAGLVGALGYIVSRLDPADTAAMVETRFQKQSRIRKKNVLAVRYGADGWSISTEYGMPIISLELFDRLGRCLYSKRGIAETRFFFSTSIRQGSGVYTLRVRFADRRYVTRPLCTLR
jgi:hypothetical protein